MASIEFYERSTIIKRIEDNLSEINRKYFEGNHGILSVTDNGDYVTVKNRGVYIADYDAQKLFNALEDFSEEDLGFLFPYGLWDYLEHCKYTPESQKLFVKLEDLLDEIDCTYFSHCRSKLLFEQQNDEIADICKNDECLSFFVQPLVSSLNNVSDIESFDDLWDYLKYEFQYHGVKSDNELKTDDELSFSEKQQVALVDMLLEPALTLSELVEKLEQENKRLKESVKSLALLKENDYQECLKYITSEKTHFNKCIKQLQEEYQELERKNEILEEKNREIEQSKEFHVSWVENLKQRVHDLESTLYLLQQETNQITVLNESVTQLHIRIYALEQENKQLKSNQTEPKPEPKSEPKPTAKRPKFKLPENFADYQQECDDLINALSCFYNIKKGKWNGDILQFILTPTDTEKANQLHLYPDKWKAGLYLQPGQWTIDKVNLSDPDEWEEWFIDVNDFADSNDIEIS